jgi:hypothetical protein
VISIEEAMLVLAAMPTEYTSKTLLMRQLRKNVDAALKLLMREGFVEGISLSGGDIDHFRLTEKGKGRKSVALTVELSEERAAEAASPTAGGTVRRDARKSSDLE